jgi:DNA-binding transcriptional ArsR family regulator
MPQHQTANYDPMTAMMQINKSNIFEMIISLTGIIDSWKMPDLAEEAKAALGDDFVTEAGNMFRKTFTCCIFTELAVDYPDRNDVEGFLEYVRTMPAKEFIFYLLGRWFPRESIPADFDPTTIQQLVDNHKESEEIKQTYPDLGWVDDLESIKKGISRIWDTYWNGFFREKAASIQDRWIKSVHEKQDFLEQHGGTELYKQITDHEELPKPIPADVPITNIELIPLCYTPSKTYVIYGYGSLQLLFDCSRTREHEQEIDAYKTRSLIALKALSDENRLKILKIISQNERLVNGKRIARKLELSASVVSRHLAQLKGSGLIEEHSTDNRNITYSFNISRFRGLGEDLEAYIRD